MKILELDNKNSKKTLNFRLYSTEKMFIRSKLRELL